MPNMNDQQLLAYADMQRLLNEAINRAVSSVAADPRFARAPIFWSQEAPLDLREVPSDAPVDGCDCVYCQSMREFGTPLPPPPPPLPRRILEVPSNLSAEAVGRLRRRRDIELRFVEPKPVETCPAGYEGEDH